MLGESYPKEFNLINLVFIILVPRGSSLPFCSTGHGRSRSCRAVQRTRNHYFVLNEIDLHQDKKLYAFISICGGFPKAVDFCLCKSDKLLPNLPLSIVGFLFMCFNRIFV